MSKDVHLLGDAHGSESVAKSYQRFAEVVQPDSIFVEASGETGREYLNSTNSYRTFEDVYSEFDISNSGANQLIKAPIYSLDNNQFFDLVSPVKKHIENTDELSENQEDVIYLLKERKNAFHEVSSTLNLRLGDVAGMSEANVYTLEDGESREEMYQFGAENIEPLPNDVEKVQKLMQGVYHQKFDLMEKFEAGQAAQYLKGCRELLSQYRPIRDRNMAERIESQMIDDGTSEAVATVGEHHLDGIQKQLPESWNVNAIKVSEKSGDLEIR